MEQTYLHAPESKIKDNELIIYGAGQNQNQTLIIGKARAILLLIEIYKFLKIKESE